MEKIELEMRRIAAMSRAELVSQWPTYFSVPPPHKASIEFLRMAIAWHRQARECPATIARVQRRLSRIAAALAAGKRPREIGANARPPGDSRTTRPNQSMWSQTSSVARLRSAQFRNCDRLST